MKKSIYIATFSLFTIICIISCNKQKVNLGIPVVINVPHRAPYIDSIKSFLKATLKSSDYESIDFEKWHTSKDAAHWYTRIALKNKLSENEFVLLQTDTIGTTVKGKFVRLHPKFNEQHQLIGAIELWSLDRNEYFISDIENGYIKEWHINNSAKEESFPVPYDQLPEVIVYGRPNSNSGFTYDTYLALQSMFEGGKGATQYPGGTLYGNTSSYNGGGSSSSGSPTGNYNSGNGSDPHADFYANIESSPLKPGINLNSWLKCFTNIPDAGANCFITICADMPVDDDPSVSLNLYTGATGHCFLKLTKTNGSQSVTQYIGFTAQDAMQAVIHGDEFVPAKIVDNASHKYDASISMAVSPEGFQVALDKMKFLSNIQQPYSITLFDCLDYDLAVFNSVRGNDPLQLPKNYSSGNTYDVISTGQRFYQMLEDMKLSGDSEAPNIWLGNGAPNFAGVSHGACQ